MIKFGKASLTSLAKAHPKMQEILRAAIKETDFRILDATRGRDAQEKAFAAGHSKVHFGDSAHNYVPSIAVDLLPAPYDWNDGQAFRHLFDVMMRIGRELGIPLRCGLDFNMDGVTHGTDNWDGGHYELHPWRIWAKKPGVKLYRG